MRRIQEKQRWTRAQRRTRVEWYPVKFVTCLVMSRPPSGQFVRSTPVPLILCDQDNDDVSQGGLGVSLIPNVTTTKYQALE